MTNTYVQKSKVKYVSNVGIYVLRTLLERREMRLSTAGFSKFLPLYLTFVPPHLDFTPYFFIFRSGSPYILPLYPTTTIKYHYPTTFIFYYNFFFNY